MTEYDIKDCKRGESYIFISYSSKDKEKVHSDVVELQKRGYNIWIDEELDGEANSWKEEALPAIANPYCSLVLFYLSEHSLISPACQGEMYYTKSNLARKNHADEKEGRFKDVPTRIVEITKIDDFQAFKEKSMINIKGKTPKEEEELLDNTEKFVNDFLGSDDGERKRIKNLGDFEEFYKEIKKRAFKRLKITPLKNDEGAESKTNVNNVSVSEDSKASQVVAHQPNEIVQESVFEQSSESVGKIYSMTNRGSDARGHYMLNGKDFLVLKGSKIASEPTNSCPEGALKAREQYASKIVNGELVEDILFPSVSGAAAFVSGASINGKEAWKETTGSAKIPPSTTPVQSGGVIYRMSNRGSDARGYYMDDGKGFVVLKGSRIAGDTTDSYQKNYADLRPKYADSLSGLEVIKDIEFTSISTAASFVAGHGMNGKDTWKNELGQKVKEGTAGKATQQPVTNEVAKNPFLAQVLEVAQCNLEFNKWGLSLGGTIQNNFMALSSQIFRDKYAHKIDWYATGGKIHAKLYTSNKTLLSIFKEKEADLMSQLETLSLSSLSDAKVVSRMDKAEKGFLIETNSITKNTADVQSGADWLTKATDILLSVISEYC